MASRGYVVGFERTLGWGFAALAVAYSGMWVIAGVSEGTATGGWLWSAIAVGALAAALTLRSAYRHSVGPADVARLLIAEIAVLLAWSVEGTASIVGGLRVTAAVVVVFGSIAFVRIGLREVFIVLAVGIGIVVDLGTLGLGAAIEGTVPVLAVGVSAASLLATVRRAARRADAAADVVRLGLRGVVEEEAELRVEEELRGVLHDHVAAALRAISSSVGRSTAAREASRGAMAAIAAFGGETGGDSSVDLAAVLRQDLRMADRVRVFATTEVTVPAEIAKAFRGAVAEAVRNAHRHGDATRIDIIVADDDALVTASVADDGRGFDPARALTGSHGVRYSVIRRMETVGGSAEVESSPGQGTVVRLSWAPVSLVPDEGPRTLVARARPVVGDLRTALALVFGPYLALNVIYSVWHTATGDLPWWPLLWFAGLVGIAIVLLVRLDAPPTGIESALYSAYIVAGLAAIFAFFPAGTLHDYAAWPVGAGGQILALLIVARPRWEAITATACQQALIIAAVAMGQYEPGRWPEPLANVLTAMASTIIPVGLTWAAVDALARLGDSIQRSRQTVAARLTERYVARARASAARRWVADPEAEVLPFLAAVASRTISTIDPATRAAARSLESSVRDELVIPGILDSHSRALLRRARSQGARVVFQTGASGGVEPEIVRAIVVAAVSADPLPREVTVSVQGRGASKVTCVVAIPGALGIEEALERALGSRLRLVESSADVTWAEVPALTP